MTGNPMRGVEESESIDLEDVGRVEEVGICVSVVEGIFADRSFEAPDVQEDLFKTEGEGSGPDTSKSIRSVICGLEERDEDILGVLFTVLRSIRVLSLDIFSLENIECVLKK